MSKERAEMPIDPKRCAKAAELRQGRLSLANFDLPTEMLGDPGEVSYRLQFGVDPEGYVYIHGFIEATLQLQCQRCLKPMEHIVHSEFNLSPVQSEHNAAALPERYEAVLMEQDKLSVLRMVEDELILNLPISPMHDWECR